MSSDYYIPRDMILYLLFYSTVAIDIDLTMSLFGQNFIRSRSIAVTSAYADDYESSDETVENRVTNRMK